MKRKRLERALPVDPEDLRRRVRTWGLAFCFARSRHPGRPALQDATPAAAGAYLDHLLGDRVAGFSVSGSSARPPFWLVLAYDTEIRKKAAKFMNDGLSFARALAMASKDPEVREQAFVTPLLLHVAASARSAPPPPPRGGWPGAASSTQQPPQKQQKVSSEKPGELGKGGGKGGKGKGKNKDKGANVPENKGDASKKKFALQRTTADGREICFKFQRGTCTGPCERVHVCNICLGNHSAKNCPKK